MLWRKKEKSIVAKCLPDHIGIIMDGNGRWARKRGLPRSVGHKAGANNFRKITKYCSKIGMKYLTVYAFSTENWSRPEEEINYLMRLFEQYLKEALSDFEQENIKVLFLGDKTVFSDNLQKLIDEVEKSSQKNTGMVLNIAMNYGGRQEITEAIKKIAVELESNKLKIENVNEKLVSEYLYTAGQPDPDLIIRPSGELRLSNFLLWQGAYSELVFFNVLWPDFSERDLNRALNQYASRNRRFGGI